MVFQIELADFGWFITKMFHEAPYQLGIPQPGPFNSASCARAPGTTHDQRAHTALLMIASCILREIMSNASMVPFGLTCQADRGASSGDGNRNESNATTSSSRTTGTSVPSSTFAFRSHHYATDSLYAALALHTASFATNTLHSPRPWRRTLPPSFQGAGGERDGSCMRIAEILDEAMALFDNNDWTSNDSVRSSEQSLPDATDHHHHHHRVDFEERQ
jgi:hypothetical protein